MGELFSKKIENLIKITPENNNLQKFPNFF
jgi:hypothetical protein